MGYVTVRPKVEQPRSTAAPSSRTPTSSCDKNSGATRDASGPARRGNAKPALTTRTPVSKGLKWLIPTIPHPPP
jgi:hypothetical protein